MQVTHSLQSLYSVEQFRDDSELAAWFSAVLNSREGRIWSAAIRNYCLRSQPPSPITDSSCAYELGRMAGRSELLGVLLSCADSVKKPVDVEPTYLES